MISEREKRLRRNNGGASLSDIRTLITALGGDSVVVGMWDFRSGVSATGAAVDSWADVRGALAAISALTAAGAARPTKSADGTLAFDAVANVMTTISAGLAALTSSLWVALVARGTSTIARRELELSIDTTTIILAAELNAATAWSGRGASTATAVTSGALTASPRVLHVRRTSTVDVAARVGNAAEVTTAQVTGDQTVTKMSVGASRSGTTFSGMQGLRAIIVGKGVYTAGQVALVNAWAQAAHGAVLTN